MEQSNTTTEAPEPQVAAPELVRPHEGRVLGGVAQGLANRFDIPVWLVRLVFIITALTGGLGLILYVAGWFLMRAEDEAESHAERFLGSASGGRAWIGIGLVFVGVLILADQFTFLDGGVIWAVGLLVAGVLIYTGDLPRLTKRTETKEGVQQMTTNTDSALVETPSSGAPTGGAPPPTPTPTPPILPPQAREPREKSYLGRLTIGFMLLGVGVLAVLDNIEGVPVYPEPRHYMALAVTMLGLGLMVGGFVGKARWLILVGVVLVPTMLFSPVFEYDWTSESFEIYESPSVFTEVDGNYSLDIGDMQIDLTELPWDGQTVEISASVDAGNLTIRVPQEVGIVGEASVDVGRVFTPGRESAGLGNPTLTFDDDAGELGTVLLDAHVDVGNIEIYYTR